MIDMKPIAVSEIDLAFGGDIRRLMPAVIDRKYEDFNSGNQCVDLISTWFFSGLPKDTVFVPRPGIDKSLALRHITAILRSFAPSHEEKTAACAQLLDLWFADALDVNGRSLIRSGS